MSYSCYSGNFSSRSSWDHLSYPRPSCGSSYPNNLVCSTNLCSPRTCQLGSSLFGGCQDTFFQPRRCQASHVVPAHCQRSCYLPRASTHCSPCQTTYAGSLGFGSSSCHSLGYGSRSSSSLSCGPWGFRPQSCRPWGFPSLGYGSGVCHTSSLPSQTCQASCYRPTYGCGSGY